MAQPYNCYNPALQEIQVLQFKSVPTGQDTLACYNCGVPVDQIYKEILKKAIYDNEMEFKPQIPNQCDTTWRVVQSSCWAEYEPPYAPPGTILYTPCDSSECCSIGLKVCRYGEPNPGITIETLGLVSGMDSCQNYLKYVWTGQYILGIDTESGAAYLIKQYAIYPCSDRCSWLYALDDVYIPKININFESKEIIVGNDYKLKISTYYDYIELELLSQEISDDLNIFISDLQGQKLFERNYSISKGTNNYKLNTGNLTNGVYFITLNINGVMLKTEKIIVIK